MNNNEKFDITVIGGGIIGVFTAYHCISTFPDKKILLITAKKTGEGISNISVALSSPINENDAIRKMYNYSQFLFEKYAFIENYKIYKKPIFSITPSNIDNILQYDRSSHLLNKHDKTVFYNSYHTIIKFNEADHIYFNGIASYFNITELLSALKTGFMNRGGKIIENTFITKIISNENEVTLFYENNTIISKKSIIAIGCFLPTSPLLSLDKITSKNKKIIAFSYKGKNEISQLPIFNFPDSKSFILTKESGLYISLTSNAWGNGNEVRWNYTLDDAKLLTDFTNQRLLLSPEDFEPLIGGDNYTSDKIPIVKKLNNFKNVIYVEGASGRGLKLAPYIAQECINALDFC